MEIKDAASGDWIFSMRGPMGILAVYAMAAILLVTRRYVPATKSKAVAVRPVLMPLISGINAAVERAAVLTMGTVSALVLLLSSVRFQVLDVVPDSKVGRDKLGGIWTASMTASHSCWRKAW